MRAALFLTLFGVLVLPVAPMFAQTFECADDQHQDETWLGCFTRFLTEGADEVAAVARRTEADPPTSAQAQDDLATDLASADSTTKRDFLSMLLTSLAGDNFDDSDGELRLAYNFGPDTFGGKGIAGLSFEAVAHNPEVFDQFLQQVPEDARAAQKVLLEEELEDFDDLETKILISFLGGVGGTSWGQQSVSEYSTKLFEAVLDTMPKQNLAEIAALREIAVLLADGLDLNQEVMALRGSDSAKADRTEDSLLQAARAVVERHLAASDLLKRKNFYRLGDLVANQPQLYLTLSARNRDDLVGPDEKSAKLSYEFGTGNFNGLQRECKDKPDGQATLNCYSRFLNSRADLLRKPWRLKLEAEWMDIDPYSFAVDLPGMMNEDDGEGDGEDGEEMPPATASLTLDRVEKLVASLVIGKALKLEDEAAKDDPVVLTRFDFQSKYEDVSNDPMRQNRWVNTLTLSQRVSEETSLAVSLIYANKPEFRGMVNEELSARAGLKFEVDRATKPKN